MKGPISVAIEVQAKAIINGYEKLVVDAVLAKIEALIPGKLDDAILEKLKPEAEADVLKLLLGLADKISEDV